MLILAFKLLMTPVFITAVTLAGRRWGAVVGGLLMGLPLTSGPISFILAQEYGLEFASRAAVGNLAGQVSVYIFCLTYTLAAKKYDWRGSVFSGLSAFLLATLVWNCFSWQLLPAFLILLLVIGLVSRLIPYHDLILNSAHFPKWDLPARMAIATTFVVLLTTFANLFGPQLSGLLSPFPVFGLVLAAFTQFQQGAQAASNLLRGVVLGSSAYAAFFLIVGLFLPGLGILWTYLLASLVAVGISGLVYWSTWR